MTDLDYKQTILSAKNFFTTKLLWWSTIVIGVYLRIALFRRPRSLWADEASLALNIVSKNFSELARLLDFKQAAPVGFLYIEKLSLITLGKHEYAMRMFPLIAGVLGIYFIYRFVKLEPDLFGLLAVIMTAFSWWQVYYAAELKQYSSDSMIIAFLVFLAGTFFSHKPTKRDVVLLSAGGAIAIWISHPSVFTLASIGLIILVEKILDHEYISWQWVLTIGLTWLFSFGLEYIVSLQHIVADGYMLDYWRGAFVPSPPWSNKDWYGRTFLYFLDMAYHRPDKVMAILTLFFLPFGAIAAFIRNRKIALLLVLPFMITYIASALHRYPLRGRFLLFLTPLTYLLWAEGLRGLHKLLSKLHKNIGAIVVIGMTLWVAVQLFSTSFTQTLNDRRIDVRPVFEYIAENKQPDDILYVFARTDTVFLYYAPLYQIDMEKVIIGKYGSGKREFIQNYQDDIASLTGEHRVWVLLTGVADCPNCQPEDTQSFFLGFVEGNGGVLLDSASDNRSSGGNVYLFDMSP